MLQLLVERNHNVLLYPDWSNAINYKDTVESFDTVALHSQELHEALGGVELADDVSMKFTCEMIYLSQAMGVKVPFLPMMESMRPNYSRVLYLNYHNLMKNSWRLNGANM